MREHSGHSSRLSADNLFNDTEFFDLAIALSRTLPRAGGAGRPRPRLGNLPLRNAVVRKALAVTATSISKLSPDVGSVFGRPFGVYPNRWGIPQPDVRELSVLASGWGPMWHFLTPALRIYGAMLTLAAGEPAGSS